MGHRRQKSRVVRLLGTAFTIAAADSVDAPDEPGIVIAIDDTGRCLSLLGSRPSESLFSDVYCEKLNPEWQRQCHGDLRIGWARFESDRIVEAAIVVAKVVTDATRAGRRVYLREVSPCEA